MNSVLITGGLGYIGGRLSRYLMNGGVAIRIATRQDPSSAPAWTGDCEVIQTDLSDISSLERAVKGMDIVVHLAALNRDLAAKNPELALRVNGQGTLNLLAASHRHQVGRFVYLSTYHVYGDLYTSVLNESAATRPLDPFAISHRLGEDFVTWYRHRRVMETVVLRLSNAFGYANDLRAVRWPLIFNDLCLQAVRSERIIIRGDGTDARDFICMEDVVRAIQHVLTVDNSYLADGLFNLGRGNSLTTLKAARMVQTEFTQRSGRPVTIETSPPAHSRGSERQVHFDVRKLGSIGFRSTGDPSIEIQGVLELAERSLKDGT